jgi:hypothetical protein
LVKESPFSLSESNVGVTGKLTLIPNPGIASIPISSAIIKNIFGYCCWLKVEDVKKKSIKIVFKILIFNLIFIYKISLSEII